MTWSDPAARQTGDLITAAIWNQDVVDNAQYLHDREVAVLVTPVGDNLAGLSNHKVFQHAPSQTRETTCHWVAPADFASLSAAAFVIVPEATGNAGYRLETDYGAEGEAYSTHGSTAGFTTLGVTANTLTLIDITSLLGNLAAGDFVLSTIYMVGSDSFTAAYDVIGLYLRYVRS